jgi:WD40 repeat protein
MHRHNVLTAAISGSGDRILTGSASGEVLVWTSKPLVPIRELPPPDGRAKIGALALSPDGAEALVAADWKATVERWDVDAAAMRGEIAAHSGRTTALAYAPDGRTVATGGADRLSGGHGGGGAADDEIPALARPTVRLWKDGAQLHDLPGLVGRIGAIAFSADGARIAAGGDDAVKVWRTADGAEVATYDLAGETATVAFRGDDVCAVSSKAAACFAKGGTARIDGARAPTRAAAITARWLASGTYEEIEVRGADGAVAATVPGRAYAIVGVGDDLWVILADRAIPVVAGTPAAAVTLKAP